MVVGQLQPDFQLCWNRWVLVIFKPSFFMWSSLVSLISLFADLRIITSSSADRPSAFRRWRRLAQVLVRTEVLHRFDCESSHPVNIWFLHSSSVGILPFSEKANICSSCVSILGCERKVVITASYQVPEMCLTVLLNSLHCNTTF